ncbi:RNase adapter RapZ [Thermovibrio sp.]
MSKRILLLTGESGAGKSGAVKHLEDLGFYCIDNIPPDLIPEFLRLIKESSEIGKAALVVDIRNPKFRTSASEMIRELKEKFPEIEVWYFTADKLALLKRFKETRRPHPFQKYYPEESLERLIELEKEHYEEVKSLADKVIDTTNFTVHDLKRHIKEILETGKPTLQVNFLSFGFKYGIPQLADNVFDVRFLPNPHFVPELKSKTGMDGEVVDYIMSFEEARKTLDVIYNFVKFSIPLYNKEGKSYITFAVGCTGGQHRSVAFAELLSKMAAKDFPDYEIFVEHREQGVRERVKPSPEGGR